MRATALHAPPAVYSCRRAHDDSLGCDLVQGYYYAKPMAADALLRDGWLRREPTGSSGQN